MKPGTVNKVKGSEIYGDFVGHDKITNIIMFQDKEREFVVTHNELIYSAIVESSLHILNTAYFCT